MTRRMVAVAITLFWVPGALRAQTLQPQISAEDLKVHVRYLASDELEGRKAGSAGNAVAAAYIAGQLGSFGVKPAGDDGTFTQAFQFVSTVKVGTANALALHGTTGLPSNTALQLDRDFRPLSFSSNETVQGTVVFAGYGITAPEMGYDDYAGLQVEKKIVVVMRYAPDGDKPHSDFAKHSSFRNKARIAREKGASGLVIITGPTHGDDDLIKLTYDQNASTSGLPVMSVRRSLLLPTLTRLGKDLKSLQDSIAATRKPISFEVPDLEIAMTTDIVKVMGTTSNVVGYLEGSDPILRDEVVVLGAHFDHLGMGGEGSGSLRPDTLAVHNGADDNASGTAGLLELAQKFAAERNTLKRSVLFAFFSAEEVGTLGSQHYVVSPWKPLRQTVAMLNMDMIGRISEKVLTVGGTGTSPAWNQLLGRFNADSAFVLKTNPDGFGPSDHQSFYAKEIPVLFFFTGVHDDYHKPSDDWDKLNYTGEERIVHYVYEIAHQVLNDTTRPGYAKVDSAPGSMGDRRGFTVTLGIVPDYAGGGTEGMKISSVRSKGPADKGGIKAGDVLVTMGGKKVLNIYDYMGILGELKAGDVVEVEVLREGVPVKLTVTMEKR